MSPAARRRAELEAYIARYVDRSTGYQPEGQARINDAIEILPHFLKKINTLKALR